ncbi:hypothetical protein ACF052_16720 [Streptomyces pilosus]|uniref:hypothetical protein n=1 Tax=Streptomyces pilosus TaxID=28893 RepID=UPI0036FC640E
MPADQHHDPFETRLAAALRDTGDGFHADVAALTAGGEVRGRRAQLLRRTAVLGGAAGIALVGLGGALLVPGGGSSDPRRSTAAAGPAASASAAPAASFSGDDLLRILKELLPAPGEFGQESARGTGSGLPPYARLVYDDGGGAAAVGIGLRRVEPGSPEVRELTRCPDRTLVDYDDCTSSRLPDGSLLMLFQGYEYPDRREDTKWWNAELVTAEGQHVSLSEWNAPAQKGAEVSRAEPPLSMEELKEVVTAGVWRRVVDAVPDRPGPSATGTPQAPPRTAPGESVGATLAELLPDGLTVVGRGGQESEYAYLVVDDGKGRSLVQINVQPDMSDVAGQLYGDAETLPDGTLVTTRKGPGEKGAAGVVMWTADTMRPDGFRVVVTAFNTGAQHQDATRDAPALTVGQLREIALSPRWQALG